VHPTALLLRVNSVGEQQCELWRVGSRPLWSMEDRDWTWKIPTPHCWSNRFVTFLICNFLGGSNFQILFYKCQCASQPEPKAFYDTGSRRYTDRRFTARAIRACSKDRRFAASAGGSRLFRLSSFTSLHIRRPEFVPLSERPDKLRLVGTFTQERERRRPTSGFRHPPDQDPTCHPRSQQSHHLEFWMMLFAASKWGTRQPPPKMHTMSLLTFSVTCLPSLKKRGPRVCLQSWAPLSFQKPEPSI
jgi:hypothetical protein